MTGCYFGRSSYFAQLIVGLPSARLYSALNILLPPTAATAPSEAAVERKI